MRSTALSRLREDADAQGFELLGIAPAHAAGAAGERLREFVRMGRHGDMGWMAETAARRAHPNALWPAARSVIMLGMNYGPAHDPLAVLARKNRAAISVYAQGRDYHDVIKGRLKTIAGRFAAATGSDVKVFVDTAPVMEKPLAEAAGIGWQGKHTNLVSRSYGSWLFLGAIFTDAELPADAPESDHCGSCRACLDICPTNAFPAPYQLDARRCISYLTIEHKGHIPLQFRAAMGNRVYGCDDCLAICPWNKFARTASEQKLQARTELDAPELADLLQLDDAAFRARFAGTAVKRTGHERFLRNVLIAAGNSGEQSLIAQVGPHLDSASPLVRAMAVWALARLMDPAAFSEIRAGRSGDEDDAAVRQEWDCAA